MGEVDKPFGCPQPGCGMSFTNEDHLMVHRRRHEMQLMVNGDHQTPSLVKHGFIIDQTPTPTRFLRQCEEVGLFQEISLNPFDEQFRRASL
ncbi:cyclic AMP-dependent transcription factor ATF-7-like [Macrobrachium nipponense]